MTKKTHTSAEGLRILKQIRALRPFVQASYTVAKKRCGNPKCRCATEGPIHESARLTWKEKGKTITVSVPIELRDEVSAWAEEARRLKRLIAEMSKEQLNYLSKLKSNR
jgi:hypothetical protein